MFFVACEMSFIISQGYLYLICYMAYFCNQQNEPKQDSFIENGIENGNAAQGACFTEVVSWTR